MSAGLYKIWFEQGATFNRVLTWRNPDATPIDLTGYTARMQVRPNKLSADVLLSLTTQNGRITLGGALGTITLDVDATVAATISAGQFVYDLELISSAGEVTRLIEGAFVVDGEVTR
jgi:hypothetical protein